MNQKTSSGINDATIAAYYLYGLEAGIFTQQNVKEWAFSIIESSGQPPAEIIAIGLSGGLPELTENLNSVPGMRNAPLVGRCLLSTLRKELESAPYRAKVIIRQAMQIAYSTGLQDDYDTFNSIDDMFSLAETNTYGTVEQCFGDLLSALAKYDECIQNSI